MIYQIEPRRLTSFLQALGEGDVLLARFDLAAGMGVEGDDRVGVEEKGVAEEGLGADVAAAPGAAEEFVVSKVPEAVVEEDGAGDLLVGNAVASDEVLGDNGWPVEEFAGSEPGTGEAGRELEGSPESGGGVGRAGEREVLGSERLAQTSEAAGGLE